MKRLSPGFALMLLCSLSVAGSLTEAGPELCETPSPELLRLGDQYYKLDTSPLQPVKNTQILKNFYRQMQGQWHGELVDTYCLGTGESSRLETKSYILKNSSATLANEQLFTIRSEKHLIEKRRGSNQSRVISIKPDNRIDFFSGSDLTSIQVINENSILATSRFRQGNKRSSTGVKHSTLRERNNKLTFMDDSLQIETYHYSNGYFTGYETISLTRY